MDRRKERWIEGKKGRNKEKRKKKRRKGRRTERIK